MTPMCRLPAAPGVSERGSGSPASEQAGDTHLVSQVAIVGHRELVRNGLERIVSSHDWLELVLVTPGVTDALDTLSRRRAKDGTVVVLLGSHGEHGADAAALTAAIRALSESGCVLLIKEFEARQLSGAIRAGAFGCVGGEVDEEELLLAVRTVERGGIHVSPSLSELLRTELRASAARPARAMLGPRETEALSWLAAGLTHREIASRMGLTEASVNTYVKRVRNKVNARNKAELTRLAIELGLLHQDRFSLSTSG